MRRTHFCNYSNVFSGSLDKIMFLVLIIKQNLIFFFLIKKLSDFCILKFVCLFVLFKKKLSDFRIMNIELVLHMSQSNRTYER